MFRHSFFIKKLLMQNAKGSLRLHLSYFLTRDIYQRNQSLKKISSSFSVIDSVFKLRGQNNINMSKVLKFFFNIKIGKKLFVMFINFKLYASGNMNIFNKFLIQFSKSLLVRIISTKMEIVQPRPYSITLLLFIQL